MTTNANTTRQRRGPSIAPQPKTERNTYRNGPSKPAAAQSRNHPTRAIPSPTERTGLLAALPPLSTRMHKLLVHGDRDSAYSPGNRQRGGKNTASSDHAWAITRALAADAVRVGWDRASFVQVLVDGPYKAGHHARTIQHRRGYDRAAEWVRRAWDGAQRYVQTTDPITTRQAFHAALAVLRARIERTPWKGIAGKTDLRNVIARMEICAQVGSWDHTISERDLAERMGCSRTTAHNSNRRLLHAKLLRQLDHGSPIEGARWMLISHPSPTTSHPWSTHKGPKAGGAMSGPAMRHSDTGANIDSRAAAHVMHLDAFAHHGLSGSGLTLLAALAERDEQTLAELQGAASVSRPTAYRQLNKLKKLKLVEHFGEVYKLSPAALNEIGARKTVLNAPGFDWVEAARELGTAGVGERRRQQHEVQRARWAHEQARLKDRRRSARAVYRHPAVPEPKCLDADGCAVNPVTGEVIDGLYMATDGEWIWHEGDSWFAA